MKKQYTRTLQIILIVLVCALLPCDILFAAALPCNMSSHDEYLKAGESCSIADPNNNMSPINYVPYSAITHQTSDQNLLKLAEDLGWRTLAPSQCTHCLCGGYFSEPVIPGTSTNLQPITTAKTTFSANSGTGHLNNGVSTLSGNLIISQPGRIVTADVGQLTIKNGQYTDVNLYGNVHFRETGRLVIGQHGHMNLQNKSAELYDVIYRLFLPNATHLSAPSITAPVNINNHTTGLNGWGSAAEVSQTLDKIIHMVKISYSTCPPSSRAWEIEAKQMDLDQAVGRGYAHDATLYAHGIPILYAPYFNFPINNKRQSGFLFPTYSTSSLSGVGIGFPYYWNMAPNYDDTITPRIYTKRGVELNNAFRYLTPSSNGIISLSFLPDDRAFSQFQEQALTEYAGNPALSSLENSNNNRYYVSWQDNTVFNNNWSGSVTYTRVSDDYYLEDFGATPAEVVSNQLLEQGIIKYSNDDWNFLANLQSYQTLHPVNQAVAINQYSSLPQLLLTSNIPVNNNRLNFELTAEVVNFTNTANPGQVSPPQGARLNFIPGIILPIANASGYFTPQLQFEATQYDLRDQPYKFANDITRALPIFDIDTGLYFDRSLNLFGHNYTQTLEPRIYYLYVPYQNQNDIPDFDSALQPFTYDQLFRTNRFSGTDRLGDANQISFGLSTRFLDQNTGEQKLEAGIGIIRYFEDRRVSLCNTPHCADNIAIVNGMLTPEAFAVGTTSPTESTSPLVGQLIYNFNPAWNASANLAWDPHNHETQNGNINLQYSPQPNHIINLGYNFLRYGDPLTNIPATSSQNDLSQPGISFVWPILDRWQFVGSWNYNYSHAHFQTYFYGLQYDSCCWAIRLVSAHTFDSINNQGMPQFNNTVYLQWQLKGLGTIGINDPTSLLVSSIPGYQETFGQLSY